MGGVVFSGADGSGKSTVASALRGYLLFRGVGVCLHWFRGSHLFVSVLLRFLSHFRSFRGLCNPYYLVCIPRSLRHAWAFLEFLGFLPHLLIRRLLDLLCFVVGDRGVLDFVVWVAVTLDYPGFLNSIIGRFLLSLALREFVVYLHADVDVLIRRCDVPRPFLLRELAYYRVLSRYYADYTIDTGALSPAQVVARVLRLINAH